MTRRLMGAGIDIMSVFAARLGGIVVALLFLPLYQSLLSPSQFGIVALILSLQSLFITFDLGFSTIIGTEIAAARRDQRLLMRARDDWHHTEFIVLMLGLTAAAVLASSNAAGLFNALSTVDLLLATVLIAGQLAINVAQAGMLALQRYRTGTSILAVATFARAIAALFLMTHWRADVHAFLVGQASITALHIVIMRTLLSRSLAASVGLAGRRSIKVDSIRRLWARSKPMMMYTLAGALALQLDKSIVANFFSLRVAGYYYLASVYALTPIAVLGGPLFQYFLPKVAMAEGDDARLTASRFQFLTVAVIVAPTIVLIVFVNTWLGYWLPRMPDRAAMAPIAALLIGGAAIGSTAYYPAARMLANREEATLSRLSLKATALVLLGTVVAAATHHLIGIAICYVLYHLGVCTTLWTAIKPSRNLLWSSYLVPLAGLTSICLTICFCAAALLPSMSAPFVATGLSALASAGIAWIWWRLYGSATVKS